MRTSHRGRRRRLTAALAASGVLAALLAVPAHAGDEPSVEAPASMAPTAEGATGASSGPKADATARETAPAPKTAPAPAAAAEAPTGCGYGTGGRFASTICWLDMTGYNDVAARTAAGQDMTVTLPGGYSLRYNVKTTRVPDDATTYAFPGVTSQTTPHERQPNGDSRFAFGSEAYRDIPGRPALYSNGVGGGSVAGVDVTLSGISLRDAAGSPVTSYAFVATDTEDNITGESLRWSSDKRLDRIETLYDRGSKGCKDAGVSGLGTTTVTCVGTGGPSSLAEKSTSILVSADAPSTFALRLITGARSGIAFGIQTSSIEVVKQVDGRANRTDSFDVSVTAPSGSTLATATTGTAGSATTGAVVVVPPDDDAPFTLTDAVTPGSGTDAADYTRSWSCTRNGQADPSLPSGQQAASVSVPAGVGDQVVCTVTNSAVPFDRGDAPASYGTLTAGDGPAHELVGHDASTTTAVPMLGARVDAEQDGAASATSSGDDDAGTDDEDGVAFNTDVTAPGRLETVYATASAPGFLNGWIDYDRNGVFDDSEHILADMAVTTGVNRLTYATPTGAAFVPGPSHARFRLTGAAGLGTSPTGTAPDGEVEDYVRTLFDPAATALGQCPVGAQPQPVTIIQNPSFETRTQTFSNSSANSINFAQNWFDAHTTGGQYHVFSPTFDSGPGQGTMPFRAGADGYGFLGGHTAAIAGNNDVGEGATNTLVAPLSPGTTYVGFFSVGAGGYSRAGSGYLRLFGVSNRNVGSIPQAGVVNPTATNQEALADTPVVAPAPAGSRAEWRTATIRFTPTRAWPYLRVEARNAVPANNGSTGGQAWMSFDDFQLFACDPVPTDFGDAAGSYGTTVAQDGPRHLVRDHDAAEHTSALMLGSRIDDETDGVPGAATNGDDNAGTDDEDGLTSSSLTPGARTAAATVDVVNTTGSAATLHGWVDADANGTFQASEATTVAVPAGATSATLGWTGLPPITSSDTVVRLRLTSGALVDAPGTSAVDERALGSAPDGEVEDHAVAPTPVVSCMTDPALFNTAYDGSGGKVAAGSRDNAWQSGLGNATGPASVSTWIPAFVVNRPSAWAPSPFGNADWISHFANTGQGSSSVDNYFRYRFVLDDAVDLSALSLPMDFYADNSVPEVWVNGTPQSGPGSGLPQAGGADPYYYAGFRVGGQAHTVLDGLQHGLNTIVVRVASGPPNVGFMAQVTASPLCADRADAPDTFGTSGPTAASHGLSGYDSTSHTAHLMLGEHIDADAEAAPGADADGDDTTGVDDEDGVAATITANLGESTSVAISATNVTAADATLAGWIDLDGDGSFERAERRTALVQASSGTASYDLSFPAPTAAGDGYARFRLFPGTVADPLPTGAATAGEVEDHPVTVLSPALAITKDSDATASSGPGDTVTYTVTATNTGTGAFTTANPARVLDDLAGVLDDAAYEGDAAARVDGSLVTPPTYSAPRVSWSGPLAAGTSVVLTYSVVLTGGGDGVVRNVAWSPLDPGDPGPTPDCATASLPCDTSSFDLPKLTVDKRADRADLPAVGESVTYTVRVTSTGPGVHTAEHPATFSDDLSDVIDDGTLSAPTASVGEATITGDILTWTGELPAVGDVAEISYTLTYRATGNRVLDNTACVPLDEARDPAAACDTVSVPGSGLVHDKSVDPSSGTAVEVGDTLTYTLSFDNTSGATAATVDASDDLSDVLDDATLDAASITSGTGLAATPTPAGDPAAIAVTGAVPAGQVRTVTYQVTVKPFADQGDHVLTNALTCEPGEPTPCAPATTSNPVRHLSLTKEQTSPASPDTGDVVAYALTVHNDGAGDWTDADPARVVDDLTDVLDDALWDDTATATDGTLDFSRPVLSWSGDLAHGESVTITYSVTVTNAGDHRLANTASVPGCSLAACTPGPVVTGLPHVVPSKTSTPASGQPVQPGDTVTYRLAWTNDGRAAGVVDSTDDLDGVLDDAVVVQDPTSSSPSVTATRSGGTLRVVGAIPAGETVTVSYAVRVSASGQQGDSRLVNVLAQDTPQVSCATQPCTAVPAPSTQHPVGDLDDWKTVTPSSGTAVRAGDRLTYVLHFESTGTGPVRVDRIDDLRGVLDDAALVAGPTASVPGLSAGVPVGGVMAVTGSIPAGVTGTVTYTVQVDEDAGRGDDRLGNFLLAPGQTAPASCTGPQSVRSDCTDNPVAAAAPDPVESADVDLRLDKRVVSGATVVVGDLVRYRLRVANKGPGDARGRIVLRDPLPRGLELVSAKGRGWRCTVRLGADKAVCRLTRTLEAGRSAPAVVLVARATAAAKGRTVNRASVRAAGDTRRADNRDVAAVTVTAPPSLPETGFRLGARPDRATGLG